MIQPSPSVSRETLRGIEVLDASPERRRRDLARTANETGDLAFTKSVSASRIEGSANIPIYPAHQNKKRGVSWQS